MHSNPTMAVFNGMLVMCVLDQDGNPYIATNADGTTWTQKDQLVQQQILEGMPGLSFTPSLLAFQDMLLMAVLGDDGAVYLATSQDGLDWPTWEELQGSPLFNLNGARSAPTFAVAQFIAYLCLTDGAGSIYVARSSDGKNWLPPQRLFGDWSNVPTTPTLVGMDNTLTMCVLDQHNNIYVAQSGDGVHWPDKATLQKTTVFPKWDQTDLTPTMVVFGDDIVVCALDGDRAAHIAITSADVTQPVPWISYRENIRWSPYDDFDKHSLEEIIAYLTSYTQQWQRDKLFIAQVVDTPNFSPVQNPKILEALGAKQLNGWVYGQTSDSNVNIIMRDFVNDYEDVIQYIIKLNPSLADQSFEQS